jgi:hypothetical protein
MYEQEAKVTSVDDSVPSSPRCRAAGVGFSASVAAAHSSETSVFLGRLSRLRSVHMKKPGAPIMRTEQATVDRTDSRCSTGVP